MDSLVDREARIASASWGRLQDPFPTYIAEDGKFVLFFDAGEGDAGDQTGIYLGRTDGTPAVRLGAGHAAGVVGRR